MNLHSRLVLVVLWVLCVAPAVFSSTEIYVATDGDDNNDGSISQPFATIERAQQEVRTLIAAGLTDDVIVYIRGGVYYLSETLEFDENDSGTSDFSITWASYPGEEVIISGGTLITSEWTAYDSNIYKTNVESLRFNSLFVDDKRAVRAREPDEVNYDNSDYYQIESVDSATNTIAFNFSGNDIDTCWSNLQDVEVVSFRGFTQSRLRIDNISGQTVYFNGTPRYAYDDLWANRNYYVENVFEGLDEPGEWYLNKSNGDLYYWPLPGQTIGDLEIIVPVLDQVLKVEGTGANYVENININRIIFAHTDWYLPNEGYKGDQSAWRLEESSGVGPAIDFVFTNNSVFSNNTIIHIGANALRSYSENLQIIGNEITDIGANAIKLGVWDDHHSQDSDYYYITKNNIITDNRIHDIGEVYREGTGIFVMISGNNLISHNLIYNISAGGIDVGWGWTNAVTALGNNIISYNDVSEVMQYMRDGAAIYTLSRQDGTVIEYNKLHDLLPSPRTRDARGVYLDEGSTNIIVRYNWIYRTEGDLIFNGGATQNNTIENNVFASTAWYMLDYRSTGSNNMFNRNIVYNTKAPGLCMVRDYSTFDQISESDYNLYYNDPPWNQENWDNMLSEWRTETGFDSHSLEEDPLFVDYSSDDFKLMPQSPALGLGFEQIDMSGVGPRIINQAPNDDFNDNTQGSMWQLYEEDPDNCWLEEINERLEIRATSEAGAIVAEYMSNRWMLDVTEDFYFSIDAHYSKETSEDGWIYLGLTTDITDPSKCVNFGIGCEDNAPYFYYEAVDGDWGLNDQTSRDSTEVTLYVSYKAASDELYLSYTGYGSADAWRTIPGFLQGRWGADSVYVEIGGGSEYVTLNSGDAYLDNFIVDSGTVVQELVGHWRFDDCNDAGKDSSGYNNTATLIGNPECTDEGMNFDGIDDYLNIADDASLDMTTELTVALWMKQAVLARSKALAVKWDYRTQGCWAFQTDNQNSDELRVFTAIALDDSGVGGYGKTTSANLVAGNWYHVAFVYDGAGAVNADRLKIYVNGEEKTLSFAGTIPSSLQDSSASVKIGEFGGTLHRYFNGIIDDVRIYNRALSQGEIEELQPSPEPDLLPPSPDPMTWAVEPYATSSSSISMTATTASDSSGVQYYFDETSGNPGGSDSGWQDSPSYTDTGLDPNTEYTYQVEARDKSTNQNPTGWSNPRSATTESGIVVEQLVGHWTMDDNAATTTVVDSSGNGNDGTAQQNTGDINSPGVIDGALSFDGVDDYVNIADDPSLDMTTELTVALWMKQPVLAIKKALVVKWDYRTQGCWAFQTDNENSDELRVFTATALDDSGAGGYGKTTSANLVAGNWYHVAFVYDGDGAVNTDRLKIYVDGEEKMLSFAGTIPSSLQDSSASVKIGEFGGILHRYFNGIIDDVRIYNRVLTVAEMLELAGHQLSPIADAGQYEPFIDADGNGFELIDLDGSQSTHPDPDGTIVSYVWAEDGNPIATGVNPTVELSVGEHQITLTVTDDSNLTSTDTVTITVTGTGLVGHWQFDDGSGNIAADSSGYNNTGTLMNGPVWTGQGELSFDGIDDYVDIADNPNLDMTTKLTVALWMKQAASATKKVFVAKWDYRTQGCWAFQTDNQNPDELRVFTATALDDSGAGGYGKTTSANLVAGNWYHVAFVYDGAGAVNADRLKIYVDGREETLSFIGTIPSFLQDSSASVKIGEFGGTLHRYFNGVIDDIRIYNRALTAEEILELAG